MTPESHRFTAGEGCTALRSVPGCDAAMGAGQRLRVLDLYCCAGGAGAGYDQAGFDVFGVDLVPQKRYPFAFHQGDVLAVMAALLRGEKIAFTYPDGTVVQLGLADFDAIHASPPCQAHTAMKSMHNAKDHQDLVPATRALLTASGLPWIMENVPGAPLLNPIQLCGTMFGLGVEDADLQRHRLFETSFPVALVPECQHGARSTIGVYGGHVRNRRRARTIGIYGKGARDSVRKFDKGVPDFTADQGREAMGIDWMTLAELSQAIPPAYTKWLGSLLMAEVTASRLERAA